MTPTDPMQGEGRGHEKLWPWLVMHWCSLMPWHKWRKVRTLSDQSDLLACSCGREYAMNHREQIVLPYAYVRSFYDELDAMLKVKP